MSEFSAKKFIAHKRDGGTHSPDELKLWLNEFLSERVPDYQMAAWLMAVFFRGMAPEELSTWTDLMTGSGATLPRSEGAFSIDKHSTGGVGDKPSLLLLPIVQSVAVRLWGGGHVKIPMMSGRGLGHSGGTLDKLDSIPGFRSRVNRDEALKLLRENDYVMMGQTDDLVPADRRLYALRDVTGTVESLPLIVSSILSKKMAEGLDGLVLDVKFGPGAFMPTREKARELASKLVEVASLRNVKTVAWLTRMDEPLGFAVGNALEVQECIEFLRGESREKGLYDVTVTLAATMLEIASKGKLTFAAAKSEVERELTGEGPMSSFKTMVSAQGGSLEKFEASRRQAEAGYRTFEIKAPKSGWLSKTDARKIGELGLALGAGRERSDAVIDEWAGFRFTKKVGDEVQAGETLCRIFYRREIGQAALLEKVSSAFEVSAQPPPSLPWCPERL